MVAVEQEKACEVRIREVYDLHHLTKSLENNE